MRNEISSITAGCMLICALFTWTGAASGATQDDDFLAARDAFRAGDAVKLERYAKSLSDYPLAPYIAYWRLRLRLDQASPGEVQAMLERTKDSPVAGSLRADWMRLLATRQQWDAFDAEYLLSPGEDVELLCYTLQSRLRGVNEDALNNARRLWLSGRDQPESCTPLFTALTERQLLSADDVWARIRLALEAGNTSVARRAAEYLPEKDQPDARVLAAIAVNPQAFLDRKTFNLTTRAGRETVMYAVHRLARTAPPLAAQQWTKLGHPFSEAERGYVWGLIAYQGAQRLDPAALGWYAKAADLNDPQLAWKVRSALRATSWPDVLAAIDAMSPKESQEQAWRYWKARALKKAGRTAEAEALLAPLAAEFTFYGQLAAEELGGRGKI
ncbi:MAG: hypothetical protein ABIS45_02265, partial [Burkholderiales bacterium]